MGGQGFFASVISNFMEDPANCFLHTYCFRLHLSSRTPRKCLLVNRVSTFTSYKKPENNLEKLWVNFI